jgi:leucyl-tRNA synthetase
MKKYSPRDIEPKWQEKWQNDGIYKAVDFSDKPKYVMLTEFPYPSGDGLHLGHVREYTLGDIMARFKRMQGHNVLYPMGYDAFGLPTENYAIKNKIAPQVATDRNVANFQKQFESLGYSIDWDRSFKTTDPDYYKWTQWLFLQFFKHGLAYQDYISINWCPKCKTGLANEEVVNGKHERCDTDVEKKQLNQWMLKITKYADKLIDGLQNVDYPSRIADQQINWIGRSKGAEIEFRISNNEYQITVFTTRPDTLFGATFMVLAPEHPLVSKITSKEQFPKIKEYVKQSQSKSEVDRQDTDREKTGVFTGAYAINPVNDEQIPIWIADYVLMGYGTGAIMAVPAHDERDHAFATKFNISINTVIAQDFGEVLPNADPVTGAVCVVYDDKTKKFAAFKSSNKKGLWLAGGGTEGGESFEQTAIRELAEETGFKNYKSVTPLGDAVYSYYYNDNKNVNKRSYGQGFLFVVDAINRGETATEAHETYAESFSWYSYEDIVAGISALGGGVEHWLEMLRRAKAVIDGSYTDAHYHGEGILINSGKYSGMNSSEVRDEIVADLAKLGLAKEKTQYRLRDWIFSRQHYWGEPIPIIHCKEHGAVAVPDNQLPVTLPDVDHYEPTNTGESPLAAIQTWVNTTCPTCGKPAKRETDTMPNWAGSSWYYLRYFDAHNDTAFADRKKLDYWGSVDMYLGGMEHTTLHLLYSRFWHQFFYDIGLVPTPEPYLARRGQGIILATDGSKMSKSKGNVINPNEIIDAGYGADSLRLSIAFLAPYDMTTPWNPEGVAGTYRFLARIWTLVQEYNESDNNEGSEELASQLNMATHKSIKKVSHDLHEMGFNTAIASLMELVNDLYKIKAKYGFVNKLAWKSSFESLIKLVAPFAPHMAEEVWQQLGNSGSVHLAQWPVHEDAYLVQHTVKIAIQVNGKLRGEIDVEHGAEKSVIEKEALLHPNVASHIKNDPKKVIHVPNKLINFVV